MFPDKIPLARSQERTPVEFNGVVRSMCDARGEQRDDAGEMPPIQSDKPHLQHESSAFFPGQGPGNPMIQAHP